LRHSYLGDAPLSNYMPLTDVLDEPKIARTTEVGSGWTLSFEHHGLKNGHLIVINVLTVRFYPREILIN
jgi:hypothetical protein